MEEKGRTERESEREQRGKDRTEEVGPVMRGRER